MQRDTEVGCVCFVDHRYWDETYLDKYKIRDMLITFTNTLIKRLFREYNKVKSQWYRSNMYVTEKTIVNKCTYCNNNEIKKLV